MYNALGLTAFQGLFRVASYEYFTAKRGLPHHPSCADARQPFPSQINKNEVVRPRCSAL